MAQTNYTPIILYNSGTTGNTPSTSNLASGELAINYTDGKLFYKDNSSTLQVIGWKTTPTTAGGTGLTSFTAGDLPYYASGSALSKLGIGTSGYVLESNGSAPTWVAQSTLSVGTATNATNIAITDNTSSSATWYPTIVSATTGNLPQTTSSTKLSFVPSTGILTATGFSGAHNGTVGATTANTGAFTTLTASTSVLSPIVGAGSSTNLSLQAGATTYATIDTSGNFLIGLTSTGYQSANGCYYTPAFGYWINNHLTGTSSGTRYFGFGYGVAEVGSITQSGTTGVLYNITSDRRLKTNVEPLTNSGAIIDALLPRKFNWITDNSADMGFVTDEYQTVFPNAITGQPDAKDANGNPIYQMGDFSTSAQIAVIVAEIQSLRARLKVANIP